MSLNLDKLIVDENKKKHGILIDLDSLFDTRLAILDSMDDTGEKVDYLLNNGYYSRDRDEFEGFDLYEFRERYAKRDLNTLRHSSPTSLLAYLHQIVGKFIISNSNEGKLVEVELILNIYPYKLDDYEIDQAVQCLKYYTGNIVPVRVINTDTLNISPQWLNDNVSVFYNYNWSQWLDKHYLTLLNKRLDSVILLGPAIYPLSKLEAAQQLAKLEKEAQDALIKLDEEDDIEMTREEILLQIVPLLIGFDLVEAREFSIMLPDEIATSEILPKD